MLLIEGDPRHDKEAAWVGKGFHVRDIVCERDQAERDWGDTHRIKCLLVGNEVVFTHVRNLDGDGCVSAHALGSQWARSTSSARLCPRSCGLIGLSG